MLLRMLGYLSEHLVTKPIMTIADTKCILYERLDVGNVVNLTNKIEPFIQFEQIPTPY